LRLVLLRQIPEDDDLRRQWNALLERSGDPQVFYTYEWALAVQRAYADSLSPLVVLGYDSQGDLCGVAPLAKSGQGDQVSFLCATTGDYCDCLSVPEDRAAFIAAVLSELGKENVRNVTLTNLPADSPTVREIREQARRNGYHYFQRLAYVCAQFSLKSLDRVNNEEPQVARAKMIRRSLKAMATEGPMRLDHMRCWNDVAPELPRFMRAHVARFLVTGRISNTARAKRRVFLAELAKLLSDRGWLCLTRLMTGTKAVAWNYGFQFRGSWFWYQPTFDSDLEKYSPGRCLLVKIIHEAAGNADFKMVDLGLGAEEYKDRVANQRRETLYVTLRSSAAQHALEKARYSVAKLATTSPRVEQRARAARSAFNQLKKHVQVSGISGTANWAVHHARASLFRRDEVFFYELINTTMTGATGLSLSPIDLDLLAAAAMQYSDDEETLGYLLRGARHLRQKEYAGFALLNAEGEPVHFTWVAPFAGFHWDELNSNLAAPSPDSVLFFDSWTPASLRDRGYYGSTLRLVAAGLRQQGKRTWAFSPATNTFSVRGLEKCGFLRRFSIVRQKVLWWQWLSRRDAESAIGTEELVAL
jgi:CelD/BcsL family acetyltransferase involved in cellulose biosynthesis